MSATLSYSIAGVGLRFVADNPAVRSMLSRRLGSFEKPAEAEAAVEVTLELQGDDPAVVNDGEPVALQELACGALTLTADAAQGSVAADNRHALLSGTLAAQPVDALVRLLLARELLRNEALLLHAAAVDLDRHGVLVAVGASGSGKSTLARHMSGTTWCDEAVAVTSAGTVEATPFWNGRPGNAPLGGLIFLQRAERSTWRSLSPARATARLMAATGPLPPSALAAALRIAGAIAEQAPFRAVVSLADIDAISTWLPARLREARA